MEKTTQPQKHRFNQEDETACLNQWRLKLAEFHALVALPLDKAKKPLMALISSCKADCQLTYRQVDGIISRCESLLNGSYGNTKTELQMNAGKVK